MNFFTIREGASGPDILLAIILNIGVFCLLVVFAGEILGWWKYRKKIDTNTKLLREILEELKRKRNEV